MPETIFVPYSFVKDGIYYFTRRVPADLSAFYLTPRIQFSLRTKTARVAVGRAQRASQQLDEYWYHFRLKQKDLPGQHMLRQAREGVVVGLSRPGCFTRGRQRLCEAFRGCRNLSAPQGPG